MKTKLLLLAMAIYVAVADAQITLENIHTNVTGESGTGLPKYFDLIEIQNNIFKYVFWDSENETIILYNLNHSIYKTILIPIQYSQSEYDIQFITTELFDCDTSNIEYLLNFHHLIGTPPAQYYVKILREDNSELLFSDSSSSSSCSGCFGMFSLPIKQTNEGAKLLLAYGQLNSNVVPQSIKVYSLCGYLPSGYLETKNNYDNLASLSHPFPNPSQNSTQVNYKLPDGEKSGEIIFYNLSGTEIKRFKVDNTFNNLVLYNSDLPSGTYLYHLVTPTQATSAKKMLVIK